MDEYIEAAWRLPEPAAKFADFSEKKGTSSLGNGNGDKQYRCSGQLSTQEAEQQNANLEKAAIDEETLKQANGKSQPPNTSCWPTSSHHLKTKSLAWPELDSSSWDTFGGTLIFAYEICEQSSICFALWQGFVWGWGGAGLEVECTGHLSKQGNYLHISSAIYIDIDMSVN